MEDAGAVDLALEVRGASAVLRHDHVRVTAAVLVDVVHRVLQAIHHLDCALERAVLGLHAGRQRRAECQALVQPWARVDFYLRRTGAYVISYCIYSKFKFISFRKSKTEVDVEKLVGTKLLKKINW